MKLSLCILLSLIVSVSVFALPPDSLWSRSYGGGWQENCWAVQQTLDSGYVLAGHTRSFGEGGSDFFLVKTNADGDTEWTRTYGGWTVPLGLDSGELIC
jgi:hypothetical protein